MFANCLSLSKAILSQFTLEVHDAAKDCKKNNKPLILGVQSLLKSSRLISSLLVLVIGSISMPTCNCFHSRLAKNVKITTFRGTAL